MPAIDVRDVAEIHVQALTNPEAAGQRFLLGQQVSSYKKCAETIAPVLRPLGYSVPTTVLPYWMAKAIAPFHKELKGG
jgi:dihydroflavonol-4-reductase